MLVKIIARAQAELLRQIVERAVRPAAGSPSAPPQALLLRRPRLHHIEAQERPSQLDSGSRRLGTRDRAASQVASRGGGAVGAAADQQRRGQRASASRSHSVPAGSAPGRPVAGRRRPAANNRLPTSGGDGRPRPPAVRVVAAQLDDGNRFIRARNSSAARAAIACASSAIQSAARNAGVISELQPRIGQVQPGQIVENPLVDPERSRAQTIACLEPTRLKRRSGRDGASALQCGSAKRRRAQRRSPLRMLGLRRRAPPAAESISTPAHKRTCRARMRSAQTVRRAGRSRAAMYGRADLASSRPAASVSSKRARSRSNSAGREPGWPRSTKAAIRPVITSPV